MFRATLIIIFTFVVFAYAEDICEKQFKDCYAICDDINVQNCMFKMYTDKNRIFNLTVCDQRESKSADDWDIKKGSRRIECAYSNTTQGDDNNHRNTIIQSRNSFVVVYD
ncbi:uncharacterized protein [Onthophagus taurus]|uniref:uncharacterized protein n=1 Tax=Onthophagus taurus TaxID=166361 RepID=UPI000C2010AF|nr:uncharacterized protein LOC111418952 [Onthophagus taurus]